MLLVALAGVLAAVGVGFFSARIGAAISRDLRHDIFQKVESFSSGEFDKFSTASLITRTTNDVQQVQMLITMGIRILCYAPIMGIGGIIMAVGKSVSLSWIIALAVIVLIGLIMVIFSIAMPKFKSLQKLIDRLNLVSRENLSGLMVIWAFGNEKYEESRFEQATRGSAGHHPFCPTDHVFYHAGDEPDYESGYIGHYLGRGPCHCGLYDADRRYDGFYAIWHADHHVLFDDCRDVHYGAAGGGFPQIVWLRCWTPSLVFGILKRKHRQRFRRHGRI